MRQDVRFDYSVNWKGVLVEKQYLSSLDLDGLKTILNGNLYVFFEPGSRYIRIKTGLLDYVIQFSYVIAEIDSGNFTPFSVSCDFYSNSFEYLYDQDQGTLRIREANEGEFEITTNYQLFKQSFFQFRMKVLDDIRLIHPELGSNSVFIEWCERIG